MQYRSILDFSYEVLAQLKREMTWPNGDKVFNKVMSHTVGALKYRLPSQD